MYRGAKFAVTSGADTRKFCYGVGLAEQRGEGLERHAAMIALDARDYQVLPIGQPLGDEGHQRRSEEVSFVDKNESRVSRRGGHRSRVGHRYRNSALASVRDGEGGRVARVAAWLKEHNF